MVIKKVKINRLLLSIVFFLTFLGFYAVILILFNTGMSGFTRLVTIPLRVIIGFCLIALFFFNFKKISIQWQSYLFIFFSALFISRIITDFYLSEYYYLSTFEVLFYFISFAIVPFLTISSLSLSEKSLRSIFNSILISGFIFSILAFNSYIDYVGQVGRLSSKTVDEDILSPLILSYCSAFIMGVIIVYLLYNKTPLWIKIVAIITLVLSAVPFFLGASRGALVALFIPFLFITVLGSNSKFFLRNIFLIGTSIFGLAFLDDRLESGLLDRFLGIFNDIEEGNSGASRLVIWESSLSQFVAHPFLGDKLRVDNWKNYPHNLFLEVLQTTGMVGFIPFLLIIVNAWKISYKILKNNKSFAWIAIMFIQAFSQNMFSGSLFQASWFWTSMALVFSVERFLYVNERKMINLLQ